MRQKQKDTRKVEQIARKQFGYETLRPGQKEAIQAILEGRDTLAVMPTGSGKSAIYEIAGILIPGPTVIVSPLIALQRDRVEAIANGEAAMLNSTITNGERREIFEKLESGDLEFLFLAPEQFNNAETIARLQAAKPSLFVIDEAHCISEWGHDFRPDYLRIGGAIAALGHPRILALTATAAPLVRDEIVERLGMRHPRLVVQGFNRPNIWLAVERFEDEAERQEALLDRVSRLPKPGIVYVATRKRSEELAELLCNCGMKAIFYHAGMKAKDREQAQAAFMSDEADVLVATTAFGMGVDKPNVRFVLHYNLSDSLDSYYQEIGRSGRDGETAKAVLFYNPEDIKLRQFFASSGQLDVEQVERVALALQNESEPIERAELREKTELSKVKLETAIVHLEEVGVVETLPTGEVKLSEEPPDLSEAAELAVQERSRRQQFTRSRLEMMRGYAELRSCRREYLLNYFGETQGQPCDFCDNCKAGVTVEKDESKQLFPLNSRVVHKIWGEGLVMRYEGDKMVVLFDTVGYKTLGVEIAILRGLLKILNSSKS